MPSYSEGFEGFSVGQTVGPGDTDLALHRDVTFPAVRLEADDTHVHTGARSVWWDSDSLTGAPPFNGIPSVSVHHPNGDRVSSTVQSYAVPNFDDDPPPLEPGQNGVVETTTTIGGVHLRISLSGFDLIFGVVTYVISHSDFSPYETGPGLYSGAIDPVTGVMVQTKVCDYADALNTWNRTQVVNACYKPETGVVTWESHGSSNSSHTYGSLAGDSLPGSFDLAAGLGIPPELLPDIDVGLYTSSVEMQRGGTHVVDFGIIRYYADVWADDFAWDVDPGYCLDQPPATRVKVTRRFPRDDVAGWGGAPRGYPRPKIKRGFSGYR